MNILISGAKGFVGKYLIELFKTTEHQILGYDIENEHYNDIKVFNINSLHEIEKIDCVVMAHAAVSSGTTFLENQILFDVNVGVTELLMNRFPDAFFIYLSTASIYSKSEIITEKSTILPQTQYAISKYWGERVLEGKKFAILRLSSVYGEGMKENTLIPNYTNQALRDKKIQVWGKGERLQNYIHAEDVAQYVLQILENRGKVVGKILLGVSNTEYSNIQVAEIIADETHAEIQMVNQDHSVSVLYDSTETVKLLHFNLNYDFPQKLKRYIAQKVEN